MKRLKKSPGAAWAQCLALVVVLLIAGNSPAAVTWVGGAPIFGPITLWTAPGNWSSNSVPPDNSDVVFGTGFNSGTSINILDNQQVGTLTIDTSTEFSLINTGTTSTLTINSGVIRTAASTGTQTIAAPVTVGFDEKWLIGGTGGLAVTGPVFADTGNGINLMGGGTLTLGGLGVSSSLYHLNVVSGTVNLNGGTLALTSGEPNPPGAALVIGSNTTTALMNVQGGALLDMAETGDAWISGNMAISGTGTNCLLPKLTTMGMDNAAQMIVQAGAAVSPKNGNSTLLMGYSQTGTLIVKTGGSLTTTVAVIGVAENVPSSASVSDAGSSWTVQTDLNLGGHVAQGLFFPGGAGALSIGSGGSVSAQTTHVWNSDSSININGGSLSTGLLNGAAGAVMTLQADPALGYALSITDNDGGHSGDYAGPITGPGTLHKTGASKQTLSGEDNFGGLIVDGGSVAISMSVQVSSLKIAGTSSAPSAQVSLGSALLVITSSVDGTPTSTSNSAALTAVRNLIAAGYHNGAFDSNGIASSFDQGNAPFALAYERVSDRQKDGLRFDPTVPLESIIIFNTFAGDANMDNVISFADLVAVAQHYGQSGAVWHDGDFNYDGVVSFADLVAVAQHYGQSLPSAPVPGASAEFDADMARAFAMVPEPGAVAALAFLAMLFWRRRRG